MKSGKKFETLDALRGLAAIAVAIFHFASVWAGYLAVDFFLVLSGFVLTHSYLYKERKTTPAEFVSHRVARLYPLHLFTLVTFILASLLVEKSFPGSIFSLLQNITLTQNVGINPGSGITYNYPSWSISVEFWVNVIFIYFVSRSTKSITLLLISISGVFIIYKNTGHFDINSENYFLFLNSGMVRGMASFLLGILSYRIYLYFKDRQEVKKNIDYLEWFCVLGVLLILFWREGKYSGLDALAPFLFMLVVSVFAFESGVLSRHLKKIKYLGEISYSIYLNQITVLILISYIGEKNGFSDMAVLVAYLSILVVYSHFTYRYIEIPLRNKGRDLIARMTSGYVPARKKES